jgi:transglutaminase-like putative cysteine protease
VKAPAPVGTFTERGYTLKHYRKDDLPIEERVAILQDLTAHSVKSPTMRKLALRVTKKCPARDTECESKAIFDWVRGNIRYTGDVAPHKLGRDGPVEGVDLFQSAERTVEFGGGDCDDHSTLNCTLAILNGIPCRYVTTSPTSDKKKDDYSHIFPAHGVPKTAPRKWVAADTTLTHGNRYGVIAPHGKALQFVA